MAKKSTYGSIRRFGARYGRKTKFKVGHIEYLTKSSAKCPYCRKLGIKKLAIGIFYCTKCKTKFTGKAYTPVKARRMDQAAAEEEEFVAIEEQKKLPAKTPKQQDAKIADTSEEVAEASEDAEDDEAVEKEDED